MLCAVAVRLCAVRCEMGSFAVHGVGLQSSSLRKVALGFCRWAFLV